MRLLLGVIQRKITGICSCTGVWSLLQ